VGKKASIENNLLMKFSEVGKDWHPTKNKNLTAKDVTPLSNKKVWWRCSKGHEWGARIASRTEGRTGCPHCHNEKRGKLGSKK
jgi:hypothetical protein